MGSRYQKAGEVIQFAVGGGWGKEKQEGDSNCKVAIIRGADFPDIENGVFENLPVRWEKEGKATKAALRAGDIVLEISGGTDERPTGRTVFVSQGLLDSFDCPVIPASFCRLVRSSSFIDPQYFYYWLQDMFNKGRTWGYQNRSTGLSNFQFKVFAEMEEVRIPPTIEQQQIAHILFMLDEKRRINTRLNDYLLELLKASAKNLYADYERNEDCELPEGWRWVEIDEIAEMVCRGITPKYNPESDETVLGQTCVRNNLVLLENGRLHMPKKVTEKWLQKYDLLINSTGVGSLGRTAQVWFEPSKLVVDSHITIVRCENAKYALYLGFWAFEHEKYIESLHTGSTGQIELPRDHVKAIRFVLPSEEELEKFNAVAAPAVELIVANQQESKRLAELRDTLLPKLMSGEVDVSKVDLTQLNNHLAES